MRRAKGDSLIELIIAFAVIAVGLFSALSLVYSNLAITDRNNDEVIAINMARESVEVAKQIRDSNWLAGNPFDQNMYVGAGAGSDYTATVNWSGGSGVLPSFNFTANDFTSPLTKMYIFGGLTEQGNAAGTSTPFMRLVTLHPICNNYTVVNSSDCASIAQAPKIGTRVESTVQWTRKGNTRTTTIYEDLYDWR